MLAAECLGLLQVLMQFGLGQQTSGGKFDWTHVHRHMTGRWPALTPGQTTKYAELVMAQLSEPASDKPYFTDGISKKDILQHYELNKVPHAVSEYNINVYHMGRGYVSISQGAFSLGLKGREGPACFRNRASVQANKTHSENLPVFALARLVNSYCRVC